ncbi:MAG TPA: hypothetical protein VMY37_24235 [Thermoguttaceae bacterium]|nr:hypothetical protein [Thermoguttaceae bacterium]
MPAKPVTPMGQAGSGLCPAGTESKTIPNPKAGGPGEPPYISECVPLGMTTADQFGSTGPRSGMAFPQAPPDRAFNAMNESQVRKARM